jgi:molybdopterin synthase catalytic subunit
VWGLRLSHLVPYTGDALIKITAKPLSPEEIVKKVKTPTSGCVVTYVGLIDRFKEKLPTAKQETYSDGTVRTG